MKKRRQHTSTTPALSRRQKIHDWVQKHPVATYCIAGASLLFIAGVTTFALLYQKPVAVTRQAPTTKKAPAPTIYHSPLTGNVVDSEAATKQAVTAIMIENSPDARPHSGLKEAGIVYEAIAEGGITRFLALYQEAKPELVGPVRSLRMYYVDWLAPYNASVAHIGGSAAALKEVRSGDYRDIDQFFNAGTYWRATDRYAPHNVYTNFERLDALNNAKGYTSSEFTGFPRTDGKAASEPTATNVTINFSSPLYNTRYTYDATSNTYTRLLAGEPHQDREKGTITPSSVVALRVDMERVMEDGWRESIRTIGSGAATIFQNGTAINATWNKPSRNAPLTLTDEAGKEIPLVRGQTWIAAVPNGSGGVAWN